jgi:UDP-N-acetylmuramate dehydrogenase
LAQLPTNVVPIGGGSNIILSPNIKRPLVKISPQFLPISINGNYLTCSAGTPVSLLLKTMQTHGLSGLEFSAGVPATLGGMVAMNFECWGHQISTYIDSVYVFNGNHCEWIARKDYTVGYRYSSFQDTFMIILAVRLNLNKNDPKAIRAAIFRHLTHRKKYQPLMKPTFGSVFKNPLPKKAGQLVDELNLKNMQIGGAKISDHHANFFENVCDASYYDALSLIELIQNKVYDTYNINLECEVQLIH